ncbi:lipopolysaccharide assembly protein LapA domain-containing protein [Methylovirgula sp. 4M-Z18]|uniref:lipopolysaccharide assembly protein LapA domain-containing protein n=1 Tax=Methylovirgula sp. 4M-Z18 TaxID=2293567 RepID=UPI000E2F3F45|nr:LapA family protein [Methylovirgula sp. 4M-Z18]RFB79010.1 LapA family protein [Methylovirgula sp. 4M-Z18]
MKSFLRGIILILLTVVVIAFAVINDQPARISFVPFATEGDALTYNLPLWLVIIISVGFGILIGGIAAWFGQGKHRRAARQARAELQMLRGELDRVRAQMVSPPGAPMLPNRGA